MSDKFNSLEERLAKLDTRQSGGGGNSPPSDGSSWRECLSGAGEPDGKSVSVPGMEAETDLVGRRLGPGGRYQVLSRIGEGGMGIVYLARDHNLNGASVAIKSPKKRLLNTPTLRERFALEYQTLIKLSHPHICRITDTGELEDVPFVVLQYLSGGDLADNYFRPSPRTKPRDLTGLMSWLPEIASALDFIHQQNYVHRDIKPENILFDQHGHALLGDFGIVRAWDGAHQEIIGDGLTQLGSWLGTPGYIAPEVVLGGGDYDGRADIYSLAAVVYYFLTGKAPFVGKDASAVRAAQLAGEVEPAHLASPQVSEAVSKVLQQALAKNPEHRPLRATAFVAELRQAFESDQTALENHAAAAADSLQPSPRSWRPLLLLPIAVLLGTLIFLGPQLFARVRGNHSARDKATEPRERLGDLENPSKALDEDVVVQPPQQTPVAEIAEKVALKLENARKLLANLEADSALQEINSAIDLAPPSAGLFALRGEILEALGKLPDAVEQYSQAIQLTPVSDYYARRGLLSLALTHHQAAEEDFAQAMAMEPENADYYGYRGMVRLARSEYPRAAEDFSTALRLGATAPAAKRASWHSGHGAAVGVNDAKSALVDANAAIELEPQNALHYRNRAFLHERLSDLPAAEADRLKVKQLEKSE